MKTSPQKSTKITPHCYVYVCHAPETGRRFGEKIALQNKFALQILKHAYRENFNLDLDMLNLRRLPSNKLVCDQCFFSISHSGNYVAVAVSDRPVGVDIQRFSGAKIQDVARKFFTKAEKQLFSNEKNSTDCFYFTWCKKEALWKSLDEQPPTVATVETCDKLFTTQKLLLDNEAYYLAATGNAEVRIAQFNFENDEMLG